MVNTARTQENFFDKASGCLIPRGFGMVAGERESHKPAADAGPGGTAGVLAPGYKYLSPS